MAVVSVTELPEGTASQRFGEPPKRVRRFVVTLDDPATPRSSMGPAVQSAFGVGYLSPHPEHPYLLAFDVSYDLHEGSRWHHVVTWVYEVPKQNNLQPNPLSRPDIWRWSTGGVAIPALTYYDASDTVRPLVNTAGDFFEGLTEEEPTLTAHISGNRATFDHNTATSIHGAVNSTTYLGRPAHTWRVDGISGEPAVEVVNEQEVRFFKVEATITFKQSGWNLQLPNVGWNYISAGERRRVYVWYDPPQGTREAVPASNPQPLDSSGNIVTANPGESNPPIILNRRTKKAVDFNTYFGSPPQ